MGGHGGRRQLLRDLSSPGQEKEEAETLQPEPHFYLFIFCMYASIAVCIFLLGCACGVCLRSATTATQPRPTTATETTATTATETTQATTATETTAGRDRVDEKDFEHQVAKTNLLSGSVIELQTLCSRVGIPPGRATKECMVLALLTEHTVGRDSETDFEHQVAKSHLLSRSVIELQTLCSRVGIAPGRATKECMVLALLAEHSFSLQQLEDQVRVDRLIADRRGGRARG